MREYGKVAPTFWTGETGREIAKQGHEAQVLALYLLTCHSSNMIGLYYLPLPVICHETRLTTESATAALNSLGGCGFALYDARSEVVWVPEMARYQLGEALKRADNRWKSVRKTADAYKKSMFYGQFIERYGVAYNLPDAEGKPLRSPFEAPSKPLRRVDEVQTKPLRRVEGSRREEQEQEQEKEQEQDREGLPEKDFETTAEGLAQAWSFHSTQRPTHPDRDVYGMTPGFTELLRHVPGDRILAEIKRTTRNRNEPFFEMEKRLLPRPGVGARASPVTPERLQDIRAKFKTGRV